MLLISFIFISLISFYLSFMVLAFLGFPPWEVISGRSSEYRTETSAGLRPNVGVHADFTDGKNEGAQVVSRKRTSDVRVFASPRYTP